MSAPPHEVHLDAQTGTELFELSPGKYETQIQSVFVPRRSKLNGTPYIMVKLFHAGSRVALYTYVSGSDSTIALISMLSAHYEGKYVTCEVKHEEYMGKRYLRAFPDWSTLSERPSP